MLSCDPGRGRECSSQFALQLWRETANILQSAVCQTMMFAGLQVINIFLKFYIIRRTDFMHFKCIILREPYFSPASFPSVPLLLPSFLVLLLQKIRGRKVQLSVKYRKFILFRLMQVKNKWNYFNPRYIHRLNAALTIKWRKTTVPQEYKHAKKPTYERVFLNSMFIAVQFTIAQIWNQPVYPSTDDWV